MSALLSASTDAIRTRTFRRPEAAHGFRSKNPETLDKLSTIWEVRGRRASLPIRSLTISRLVSEFESTNIILARRL